MRGLTQADVASALDVCITTIYRWERGLAGPPTTGDVLDKLANLFGVETFYLFHPNPIAALGLDVVESPPVPENSEYDALALLSRRRAKLESQSQGQDWSDKRRVRDSVEEIA